MRGFHDCGDVARFAVVEGSLLHLLRRSAATYIVVVEVVHPTPQANEVEMMVVTAWAVLRSTPHGGRAP